MQIITNNSEETKKFAQQLAKKFIKIGGVIALSGDLGTGKTTFTQGFAKGLGIKDKIISPTFVLTRQHRLPSFSRMLYHLDLYRLDDIASIKNIGIEEMIADPLNIILIECAEKARHLLPPETIWIYFKSLDENTREITTLNLV